LQVSNDADADADAISASYLRLKERYADASDDVARNELMFIEHANATLSNVNSRRLYDQQLVNASFEPAVQYEYVSASGSSGFGSGKVLLVLVGILALIAYGLNTRHSEEVGKIAVSKEAVVGGTEVLRIGLEENAQNTSKAIDVSAEMAQRQAEIAQRQIDIQRQDAETRRMEVESRIRANEKREMSQLATQQAAAEREEKCRYMRSLVTQANQAGAYAEARAIQARGCN
jgi:Tfp pilus assembly protein PilV